MPLHWQWRLRDMTLGGTSIPCAGKRIKPEEKERRYKRILLIHCNQRLPWLEIRVNHMLLMGASLRVSPSHSCPPLRNIQTRRTESLWHTYSQPIRADKRSTGQAVNREPCGDSATSGRSSLGLEFMTLQKRATDMYSSFALSGNVGI